MGEVTLTQLLEFAGWLLAGATTVCGLYKLASKVLNAALKPLNSKLDSIVEDTRRIELESCKDFLVRFLADIEQGQPIDEVEVERFYEVYGRYTSPALGGNSYIHNKVEKLKKAGKL